MPTPVTCPSCGERLDIPADLRGTPVRCAACMTVFTPPPADGPDDVPAVRPARSTPRPPRTDDVDPERPDDYDGRPRRRRKGGLTWLWVLFGGLGLVTCMCCGGCGAMFWFIEKPTFQPYTSAEGRFAVEFPGIAAAKKMPVGDKNWDGVECRREMAQESYFVHYADVPAAKNKGPDAVLEETAKELLKSARPGQVTSMTQGTHGGHPSMDVVIQVVPFEPTTGLVARVVLAGRRVYVIGVTGQVLPDADRVEHFFQSFKVTEAAGEKKADAK